MIAKILAPLDSSKRRFLAARWAAAIARRFRAEVSLVHVVRDEPASKEVLDAWDLLDDPALRKYFTDIPTRWDVLRGDPAQVIVGQASNCGADLIVMPTRGRGLLRGAVLGSVAAKVLREAPCPVWTGMRAANGTDKTSPMRILCAVALAPQSERVVRWASDVARRLRGALTIMHAEPQLELPPECRFEAEWRVELGRMLRTQLAQLQERAGAIASVALREGKPTKAVAEVAAELRADLLVIGRSPASRIRGHLGTTAYGIVRRSPCPVLSV